MRPGSFHSSEARVVRSAKKIKTKTKKAKWFRVSELKLAGEDRPRKADGIPFRVLGSLDDLLVVTVPTRVTTTQAAKLSALFEKQTKRPVMVLTDDVRLASLQEISDEDAAAALGVR